MSGLCCPSVGREWRAGRRPLLTQIVSGFVVYGPSTSEGTLNMNNPDLPVKELRNIGVTVARRLHEVGIRTQRDLERIGAVTAYCEIKQRHPEARTPLCYYLYSLEGALRGQHWDDLGETVKRTLREEVARFAETP